MNVGYDAAFITATKKAREKAGVSIPEIARLLKMTPEAYARYEEDTKMKHNIVVKFCVFLDIDTYELYCSARFISNTSIDERFKTSKNLIVLGERFASYYLKQVRKNKKSIIDLFINSKDGIVSCDDMSNQFRLTTWERKRAALGGLTRSIRRFRGDETANLWAILPETVVTDEKGNVIAADFMLHPETLKNLRIAAKKIEQELARS